MLEKKKHVDSIGANKKLSSGLLASDPRSTDTRTKDDRSTMDVLSVRPFAVIEL